MNDTNKSDIFKYFNAVRKNDTSKILELFNEGTIQVNTANDDGFDGLTIATIHDSNEMIEFFLEKGANINVQDTKGWSLLHIAAYNSRPEQYSYLVGKGCNLNHRTTRNKLPYQMSPPRSWEQIKGIHAKFGGEIDDSTDNIDNFDPVSPNPFSVQEDTAIVDVEDDEDAKE